jgi:AraC-like DNA-binding protein
VYVSVLFVRMVLSELRRHGLPDSALLEGSSVDAAKLANLRATIPLEEYDGLLLRAQRLSGDPALGLSMAEHWSVGMLQVVGQLVAACRTMRDALTMFARYQPLIEDNMRWSLEEQGERAYLFFDPLFDLPDSSRIGFEALLGFVYRIGHCFVPGASGDGSEAWFRHSAPDYVGQYTRIFNCPVHFDQPRFALVFPRHLLDSEQAHADRAMRDVLQDSAELLLRERNSEGSIAGRVRGLLRYEEQLADLDGRRVARLLGMNLRTLRRRLGAEGAPLTDLLDEARFERAQRALIRADVSIKEVAYTLGFSEASAFHRAFKRWSGQTPAEFVKKSSPRSDRGPERADEMAR